MGRLDLKMHVPFASVNSSSSPSYREGWARHHIAPVQCKRDAALAPFLLTLREDGFCMDDFVTNGVLLPMLPSQSKISGLPLHLGGHPEYNARFIEELNPIRVFCESIRSDSRRREVALSGVRGLQDRARKLITTQRAGHINRVVLKGCTDADVDGLITRLFAKRTSKSLI